MTQMISKTLTCDMKIICITFSSANQNYSILVTLASNGNNYLRQGNFLFENQNYR